MFKKTTLDTEGFFFQGNQHIKRNFVGLPMLKFQLQLLQHFLASIRHPTALFKLIFCQAQSAGTSKWMCDPELRLSADFAVRYFLFARNVPCVSAGMQRREEMQKHFQSSSQRKSMVSIFFFARYLFIIDRNRKTVHEKNERGTLLNKMYGTAVTFVHLSRKCLAGPWQGSGKTMLPQLVTCLATHLCTSV